MEEYVENEKEVFNGITKTGEIPGTWDVVDGFVHPKKWLEFSSAIQIIFFVGLPILAFFELLPQSVFIGAYAFWRLGYNVGLGLILSGQSKYESFTEFYREKIKFFPSRVRFFEKNISLRNYETNELEKYEMKNYNDYFNSWMVYRFIVDIILGCDVASYLAFCVSFFHLPDQFDSFDVVLYSIGLFLICFNLYVKVSAHSVIGDYAWYWGDFFFKIERNLQFNGVFKMFPHPMYTVGYSFYYGMALITRSYTVLYVSFLGHMLQIIFLVIIEGLLKLRKIMILIIFYQKEPHIEKIYGSFISIYSSSTVRSLQEYFSGKDLKFYSHINIFNSSDINLTIITGYLILLYFLPVGNMFYLYHVVFWRIFHSFVLGFVLLLQSKYKFWTNHFKSKKIAFNNWKKLFNTSLTINYIVFVECTFKNLSIPTDWSVSEKILNSFLSGCLIGITIWSSFSVHQSLGDWGWFYGDFFIEDEVRERKLCYSGLYRFLNNPDHVLGFSIFYGLSLFSHSSTVFLLAVFSHVCNFLFIKLIEEPHMHRIYGKENVRKHGGLEEEGKKIIKKVGKNILQKLKEKKE